MKNIEDFERNMRQIGYALEDAGHMKTHKGATYFPSFPIARDYAEEHGLPANRIIEYGRGWAIQLRVSGPYYNADKARWE